jgi:hypothetical protein
MGREWTGWAPLGWMDLGYTGCKRSPTPIQSSGAQPVQSKPVHYESILPACWLPLLVDDRGSRKPETLITNQQWQPAGAGRMLSKGTGLLWV